MLTQLAVERLNPVRAEALLSAPIHAISETQGTDGLRLRLAAEVVTAFGMGKELAYVDDAHELAAEVHAGQRRAREPYENHVLRVAIRGISEAHLGIVDSSFVAGLLLHDSVEDHAGAIADLPRQETDEAVLRTAAFARLCSRFDDRTVQIIRHLTNPLPIEGLSTVDQYVEHVEELADLPDPYPILGKTSDVMDNGTGIFWLGEAPASAYEKKVRKYVRIMPALRRAWLRSDLPVSDRARQFARTQFDKTEERFAAILAAA